MTPEAIFTPLPEVSPSIRLGVTRIWIGCTTPPEPQGTYPPPRPLPRPGQSHPTGPSPTQD